MPLEACVVEHCAAILSSHRRVYRKPFHFDQLHCRRRVPNPCVAGLHPGADGPHLYPDRLFSAGLLLTCVIPGPDRLLQKS